MKMAFEFFRAENNDTPIEKEIVATNGTTYNHGCLVAFGSAGTAVTSSTNAEFVYTGKDTVAKTGDKLAVVPVLPEYEFETEFSADGSALKAGAKVTVTGEKATATTASGIFQILTDGGASGTKIVGRFA
jgi:hypothetical protein